MNEFLEQFLVEARDLTDQATQELLALEQSPNSKERLDSVFRAMHTLKGGAGIVDFMAMSRAVHAAEDALSSVRAGERDISTELIGDCLSCVDQVVQWLDVIGETGDLPPAPDAAADAIVARFSATEKSSQGQKAVSEDTATPASDAAERILQEQLLLIADINANGLEGRLASAARVVGNVLRHTAGETSAAAIERAFATAPENERMHVLGDAIKSTLQSQREGADRDGAATPKADALARTLRVDAERVNALVSLTGELFVAKNGIAHLARLIEESGNPLASSLRQEHARLERLIVDLQHSVLSLRVLPLRTVFQRFVRVVREMAVTLEKPTNLILEGEDTEADKVIVEMLFEPLLHVVRNAMDHGLEAAAQRSASGKALVATIRMRALREGEHVMVEVIDDGRGIDIDRVRAVAIERGVAAAEVVSALSDQDAVDLIFAPGFSTAREVTGLSGRGVGMDAVRSAVEQIGGRVLVESEAGRGTTVRLVLPFSVMMTRVMTVQAGGQTFGIPLDAVVETVRIPRSRVQPIGTAGAFVVRNRTVPLVDLSATLGRSMSGKDDSELIAVITSIGGQLGAVEVDRIGERMDVMLKPIEGLLAGTPGLAGTTLLGDGQVLLVLDLQELLA